MMVGVQSEIFSLLLGIGASIVSLISCVLIARVIVLNGMGAPKNKIRFLLTQATVCKIFLLGCAVVVYKERALLKASYIGIGVLAGLIGGLLLVKYFFLRSKIKTS